MSRASVVEAAEPVIVLEDLTLQYRAQAAPTLHGLSLTIGRGEKVAIIGPSGSGKSTVLKVISGLIPHHEQATVTGTLRVMGHDPGARPLVETSRHVGTVLQDASSQFVGLTVAEDIAFSLENQQLPTAQMPEQIRRAAALVGIQQRLEDAPQDLSGGQKQRVAMAGVLVDDVSVLLFDEPLAMLDPASGREAVELIDALHRDQQLTIVLVEHRLEDVLHRDVDRIILMDEGRIIADAPPAQLLATSLLEEHGIRPPLHVAALRLAGAAPTAAQRPQRAEDMRLTEEQCEAVRSWSAQDLDPATTPSVRAEAPALELREVACRVPVGPEEHREILHPTSVRIMPGEMVGVLGSNGAGKSTLARVVAGFERAHSGQVLLGGQDATTWPLAQRGEQVAFVLQEPGQMISRPLVAEEVALGLAARGVPAPEAEERCREALGVCGLLPQRSWPVSALSHGQKKRLTIASALVLKPRILILDEPTAGQDFAHYTEFMDLLRTLNGGGTTVVLITHDMHLALEYTERTLVMHDGRIIADDHPAAVLTDPTLVTRADLVLTGLHTLAERCGTADADHLVRRFIAADRRARAERRAREDHRARGEARP